MNTHSIFIDSSAFHALLVKNDPHHATIIANLRRLQTDKWRFVTTDYIIDESVTLLKARQVSMQVSRLFELIEQSSYLSMEWIGEDRFSAAKEYLLKHNDHRYSFTDCTSFIVMLELRITGALTTDRHFREAGFNPILLAKY